METLMNQPLLLVLLSSAALPALAVIALLLRRNLFEGKLKIAFLFIGLGLLVFTVFATFNEHSEDLGWTDLLVAAITALITLFILSRFNHGHAHDKELEGAKGIVVSEAFHSLIDGAVIGATYLVSPLLGYAATLGIMKGDIIRQINKTEITSAAQAAKILGNTDVRKWQITVQRGGELLNIMYNGRF